MNTRWSGRARMGASAGAGAAVVIVAAPSGAAHEESLTLAAKHGRVSFFGGLPKSNPCIQFNANLVHYRELFVMGAYGSAPRHNLMALELLAAGRIHAESLIGLVVPLGRIHEGMAAVASNPLILQWVGNRLVLAYKS